jgi:hypothetical protein
MFPAVSKSKYTRMRNVQGPPHMVSNGRLLKDVMLKLHSRLSKYKTGKPLCYSTPYSRSTKTKSNRYIKIKQLKILPKKKNEQLVFVAYKAKKQNIFKCPTFVLWLGYKLDNRATVVQFSAVTKLYFNVQTDVGSTQPPIHFVLAVFPRSQAARTSRQPLTSISYRD